MLDIISFLKVLLELAPELRTQVETAIDKWGNLHKVPTDRVIQAIRPDRFSAIDGEIDELIAATNLPER